MEIPDSDEEEEELLPDTIQNEHSKLQNQSISSPVQFVERIIFQLNNISSTLQQHHNHHHQHEQQQKPFSNLSNPQASQVKPLMLTLHCLFPNELLLALDILDRGLVRRLVRGNQEKVCDLEIDTPFPSSFPHGLSSSQVPLVENSGEEPVEDVFLAISAASSASIFTSTTRQGGVKGYEVRLSAWNCTCPTFILSAFRGETDSGESHHHDQSDDDYMYGNSARVAEQRCARTYRFGGTLTRGPTRLSPPSCKHLLACFLLVRCPRLFGTGEGAELHRVGAKELAGWCAGWGG